MAKKTGKRLAVLLSMMAASALASGAIGAKRPQPRAPAQAKAPAPAPAPAKAPAKRVLGPAALALEGLDIKFEKFTLPNGLTVIVYPDHSQKKVYVSTTYRVGSKDEPEGKSGFAHLFEHLMFQ